jgi:eukaryotic-like serine/threonine-protein kinase
LSDRYEWEANSVDRVRLKGENKSVPISILKDQLLKAGEGQIAKVMENPSKIISIGTASCDGEITKDEESRAMARAKIIQTKIVEQIFIIKDRPLLNLGQYKKDNCTRDLTGNSFQRRLIIVGMRKDTPGLMVKEAVYLRLGKTMKDFKLDDYSLGTIDKFSLK